MFRILEHQMAFFVEKGRNEFVDRLTDFLQAEYASWLEGMEHREIRDWVEEAVLKGEHYGIDTEPEAAQLVLLFLVLDIDADLKTPWVSSILNERGMLPIGKIRALVQAAREHGVEYLDAVVKDELMGEAVQ